MRLINQLGTHPLKGNSIFVCHNSRKVRHCSRHRRMKDQVFAHISHVFVRYLFIFIVDSTSTVVFPCTFGARIIWWPGQSGRFSGRVARARKAAAKYVDHWTWSKHNADHCSTSGQLYLNQCAVFHFLLTFVDRSSSLLILVLLHLKIGYWVRIPTRRIPSSCSDILQ